MFIQKILSSIKSWIIALWLGFIEFSTWGSTVFSQCALSEYKFSSFIPVKSLSDRSPLQNDSSNDYSILGIPILPLSSSSGSKFLLFHSGIFVHVKLVLFIGRKSNIVQRITNKLQASKQSNSCLDRIYTFFYLFHCLLWACTFSTVTIKTQK